MTSTTSHLSVRLEVLDPPTRLWAFEPNRVRARLTNLGCSELAAPGADTRIEGTLDLLDADGNHRRRLLTMPVAGTVPIGQSIEHDLDIEIHDLAGDYQVLLGLQVTAGDTPAAPLATAGGRFGFALRYTIFDAFMELINVCNFKCTFCPQPTLNRKPRSMDFGLAEKIVTDLAAMGHHHPIRLHVLGEPLLYKRFFDIIEMAHDHGQRIILATNGSRFDQATADGIIRTGLDELLISLNTPEEDAYNAQRGTDMSFADYVASIERMVVAIVEHPDRAPKTRINVLYSPEELNTRTQYVKTCEVANQWIDVIRRVTGRDIPRAEDALDLQPGATTLLPLTDNLELQWVLYHAWGEEGMPDDRFCSMPWRQLPILVDGKVTACCADAEGEIELGDVNHQSIEEIWNGEPIERLRAGFLRRESVHPRCLRCGISDDMGKYFPG